MEGEAVRVRINAGDMDLGTSVPFCAHPLALTDCREQVLEPTPVGRTELGLGLGSRGGRKAHELVLQ